MIIIGYQGIGKSTIAINRDNTIDLESGNFFIDGERDENWYIPYCNIAISLSEQLNTVFVSSHEVVRDYLASLPRTELIAVCYPVIDLRREWVQKLHDRLIRTGLDKDYKAWKNAALRYEENVIELMAMPFIQIPIKSMDYSLKELIKEYDA